MALTHETSSEHHPEMTGRIPIVLVHRMEDASRVSSLAQQLVLHGITVRLDQMPPHAPSELRIAAFAKSLTTARVCVLYVTRGAMSKWQKTANNIVEAHQEEDPSFRCLTFVVGQPLRHHDGTTIQDPHHAGTDGDSIAARLADTVRTALGTSPESAGSHDFTDAEAQASEIAGDTPSPVHPPANGHQAGSGNSTQPSRPFDLDSGTSGVPDTGENLAQVATTASDDDEPGTFAVQNKYQSRPYATTRPSLRQWFLPLPTEPVTPLVDRKQIRQRETPIRAAARTTPDIATDLLQEAEGLMKYRDERIKSAETKATSLMGAVAIAASLVVAGAALILDPSKVADGWREAMTVTLLALLVCLLMSGYLSSRALLTVRTIRRPQARHALRRATTGTAVNARIDRALDLIERSNDNRYVADFKGAQNEAAHRWYKLALLLFGGLGVLVVLYVFLGALPTSPR
jgi:hypothetical protein